VCGAAWQWQDPTEEAARADAAVERCLKEGLTNMVLLRDGACTDTAMQIRATALQAGGRT
jgi:hypothetical protein